MIRTIQYAFIMIMVSCEIHPSQPVIVSKDTPVLATPDSVAATIPADNTRNTTLDTSLIVKTGDTNPNELVRFAETLIGTPYVYASSDPKVGFDCSGFITYVFGHFNIAVPRSSVDFTNVGKTVSVTEARPGDLILFTGTDPREKNVGHMGIVVTNDGNGLRFIHSTSGKAMSVTITPLNAQYMERFVKVCRVFVG